MIRTPILLSKKEQWRRLGSRGGGVRPHQETNWRHQLPLGIRADSPSSSEEAPGRRRHRNTKRKRVHFNTTVCLVLIPTRQELRDSNQHLDIWWTKAECTEMRKSFMRSLREVGSVTDCLLGRDVPHGATESSDLQRCDCSAQGSATPQQEQSGTFQSADPLSRRRGQRHDLLHEVASGASLKRTLDSNVRLQTDDKDIPLTASGSQALLPVDIFVPNTSSQQNLTETEVASAAVAAAVSAVATVMVVAGVTVQMAPSAGRCECHTSHTSTCCFGGGVHG
ncbi:unnamed protein product [Discosporangium mesarthrocarpum]